jgi:phosphoglycerate kinase
MSGRPTPNADARASAASALQGVPLLREQRIEPGERWLYSAGFNVTAPVERAARVDCELEDIEFLLARGASVAIASHQGSRRDASARELDFLVPYLQRRLRRPVQFIGDPLADGAAERVRDMRPGELALLGNTRLLDGEESCDRELARRLAALGDRVAVGGFSKAHRAHASNVGVLEFRRGYACASLARELTLLAPWSGVRPARYSVAVVGGVKREKLECGVASFADSYDLVIPGGAVLNALLSAAGLDVGDSSLGECGECLELAAELLRRPTRARIHLPSVVIVARERRTGSARAIPIAAGVPAGHEIVDFRLERAVRARLANLRPGARAVIAGTPTLYAHGFTQGSDSLLAALRTARAHTLALGGDTVSELPWDGPASTGGGSALWFIARGCLPVLDALARSGEAR